MRSLREDGVGDGNVRADCDRNVMDMRPVDDGMHSNTQ